jgi:hypothetical protein
VSVKSLIDQILPYADNWSRTGTRSILALVQEAQDELLDGNGSNRIWIGTDNEGFPPYLTTVAGTYEYDITAANLSADALTVTIGGSARTVRAKQVQRVFVDTTEGNYDYAKRYLGKPYVYVGENPFSTARNRIIVAPVPVDSYPALENTSARIRFKEDPGATDDQYFVEFTWEAPRLVSENIPFAIPKEYEPAIRDYVLGTIQALNSGKESDLLVKFRELWLPRFRQSTYGGAQADDNQVELRYC